MSKKVIPVEIFDDIAAEVKTLSSAMVGINASQLSEQAIVILLQHKTGENQRTIKNVLWGLERIGDYLK